MPQGNFHHVYFLIKNDEIRKKAGNYPQKKNMSKNIRKKGDNIEIRILKVIINILKDLN